MKSILRILVLGVVPILAATAVVDQGLAADKGSQLIFHSNMYHQNYISIANANDGEAVTVLTQYYNDEMAMVLWYLRVIPGGGNVLVDPFDHRIPGTAEQDADGEDIPRSEANVKKVIDNLPPMSFTDEDDAYQDGINSGRFLIVVTAVAGNTVDDADTDGANEDEGNSDSELANILFPGFLAADMHAVDNIDNCGLISTDGARAADSDLGNGLGLTRNGPKGVFDCRADDPATTDSEADMTSKNVGALSVDNAEPIAFNHLTGHFTEALEGTDAGGSDQTASWGGAPVIRPAVTNVLNAMMISTDYTTLNGIDDGDDNVMYYPASGTGAGVPAGNGTGRLAEKDGGAQGVANIASGAGRAGFTDSTTDFTTGSRVAQQPDEVMNRGLAGVGNMTGDEDARMQVPHGGVVLPALYGTGMTTQEAILLSVADDFGDPRQGMGGDYKLIPAMTGYKVTLHDNMGDALPDPATEDDPVFGGTDSSDAPAGTSIIVNGISVMTDANLAKCTGTAISGTWTLDNLTELVPTAASGVKTFAGLDAMLYPMTNATPGLIKFVRSALTCKKNYGDGTPAGEAGADSGADGIPIKSERTYKAGTLIVEQINSARSFVTTGQAVLKFITPNATFAASWSLKSPADASTEDEDEN